jgi:hypothetical protein
MQVRLAPSTISTLERGEARAAVLGMDILLRPRACAQQAVTTKASGSGRRLGHGVGRRLIRTLQARGALG